MVHEVTFDQNDQTIYVSAGDVIRIQLEDNPTTGYTWKLEETSPMYTVGKNEYALHRGAGIGGGGVRIIELTVEQSGNAIIQLKNWQRWSGDVYQTFQLHVQAN